MKGKGHPHDLVGSVVSLECFQKSLSSPRTTHAQLFWTALMDVVSLPPRSSKDIIVSTLQPKATSVQHIFSGLPEIYAFVAPLPIAPEFVHIGMPEENGDSYRSTGDELAPGTGIHERSG